MTGFSRFLSATTALAAALFATGPAVAQVSPADFFTGLYERVGRDDSGAPINDLVRLDPVGEGFQLLLCPIADGAPPLIALEFAQAFESDNFLAGPSEAPALYCQFNMDPQNYAILNCSNTTGALFTLWPVESTGGCTRSN